MDRIYYFILAKEKVVRSVELPVFCRRLGAYEVFYLQVPSFVGKREASEAKGWLEKGIARLQEACEQDAGPGGAYLVYDGLFEMWLREKQMWDFWQLLWEYPLYREFTQPHNLMLLLQHLSGESWPGKWIIVGEAPGVADWIGDLAKYMKAVTFFSKDPPADRERLQEYLQKEFGLLVQYKKSLHPTSKEPAVVLDYCTKEKLFVWDICKGSIWIDMNSLEARRHDVQDRDTGIIYDSLKRFWKEEIIQTLDTFNKIQYNT